MRSTHRLVRRDCSLSRLRIVIGLMHFRLVLSVVALRLDRSAYIIGAHWPKPNILPPVHIDFGPYLSFDLNDSALWAITVELYYFIIAPGVAVSHPS